jgi:hypothetical protein
MRNDETPTPRPWKVYDRGIGWEIHTQDDLEINVEFRETFKKGDAELIVRAVNAQDDLVAAMEHVQADVCSFLCPSAKKTGEEWMHSEKCRAITAALAKAGAL